MKTTDLSPFGQLALKLDQDFAGLERLAQQIERLDINTDNGLEHAIKLMGQFAQYGQGISEGIQHFAKALDESRARSEEAANLVAARAVEIQKRKEEHGLIEAKFNQLGAKVQVVNEGLMQMKRPTGEDLDPAARAEINEKLKEMDAHLGVFVEEAKNLKEEAESANMKKIGRDAESLHGTLLSARSKLSTIFA